MVNDIVLSGLTNLFALFGAHDGLDINDSKQVLTAFLQRHLGIRNVEDSLDMYADLRELYSISPDLDKEAIVSGICSEMVSLVSADEQEMILLRLMELCAIDGVTEYETDELFISTARQLGVSDKFFLEYCHFIDDKESGTVRHFQAEGISGHITTMWVKRYNRMLFYYSGSDLLQMDDVPILNHTFQTWSESSILKNPHSGARIYYSSVRDQYYSRYKSKSVEFCGRDINFRFPGSDNGVHDFSFTVRSGELVAVMGGSGAGKSTLMSILNGSMAPQSGTITINGHSIAEKGTKELIGFVPQDDLLIEELTVYQNLWYTARLCFDDMSPDELDRRVMDVLHQLGLDAARDLKVGSPINKFISGGQRKRLNIALELIREPAVLFLDEPTSGLSSTDTEKVINLLKEQTQRGKLIITNIHQPSSDVYKLFSRLWLLDAGGYPVFDGNPIEAVSWFKTAANYADSETSTCPTCGNVNPEVVLNILSERALLNGGKLSDERKMSPQAWHQMYLDAQPEGLHTEPQVSDIPITPQKKPGFWKQFCIQFSRNVRSKVTNLQYILITLLEAPALAAICALLTHYASGEGYTLMDNKNLVSYMFMAIIVAVFIGMSGSAEEIIKDRALLKREKFLNLSYSGYILSKIALMACVVLLQTLLFVLVGNSMQGLGLFPSWWGMLFLVAFLSGLTGLILSQTLNSVITIYITIPILLIPQILLCGVVVNFSDLSPDSKTGNVPVIGNVIPSRWAFEALAVKQFTQNEYDAPLFDTQRRKFEAQYYLGAYLYELQSQMETMEDERIRKRTQKPEHLDILQKNIPVLSEMCQLKPYSGNWSYASLKEYTDLAEDHLRKASNQAALAEDNSITRQRRTIGKDAFLQLKRDNHNLQLENFCISADSRATHDIVDGYIVARVGQIYLTPQSRTGNAPFYSSVKLLGLTAVPTPLFNTLVLLLMSIICSILLFCDCPGRYLRNS